MPPRIAIASALAALVVGVAIAAVVITRPGRVGPTNDAARDDQGSGAPADGGAPSRVPPAAQELADLSPHETDWDAAAQEIESLDADIEALSTEVNQLWNIGNQEEAADETDDTDRQ